MRPFSQLSGPEKALEVVRWLLVPVAAVAALFVLNFLARIALPPAMAQLPGTPPPVVSDFQRWVLRWIFNGLISGAFVFAGARMAPRGRLATALVLAGLWIVYSLLSHILVHLGQGKPNYLDFAVAAVVALLAVALVGYAERTAGRIVKNKHD